MPRDSVGSPVPGVLLQARGQATASRYVCHAVKRSRCALHAHSQQGLSCFHLAKSLPVCMASGHPTSNKVTNWDMLYIAGARPLLRYCPQSLACYCPDPYTATAPDPYTAIATDPTLLLPLTPTQQLPLTPTLLLHPAFRQCPCAHIAACPFFPCTCYCHTSVPPAPATITPATAPCTCYCPLHLPLPLHLLLPPAPATAAPVLPVPATAAPVPPAPATAAGRRFGHHHPVVRHGMTIQAARALQQCTPQHITVCRTKTKHLESASGPPQPSPVH